MAEPPTDFFEGIYYDSKIIDLYGKEPGEDQREFLYSKRRN